MKKWISKNKKMIGICIIIIVFSALIPWILDLFIFGNDISSSIDNSDWASFLGSYLGSLIGGFFTIGAVILSFRISKRNEREKEIEEKCSEIYYELIYALDTYVDAYYFLKRGYHEIVPSKIYITSNWIKNIGILPITASEKNYLFEVYAELSNAAALLEKNNFLELNYRQRQNKIVVTLENYEIFLSEEFVLKTEKTEEPATTDYQKCLNSKALDLLNKIKKFAELE